MFTRWLFYVAVFSYVAVEISGDTRSAVAHLRAENITGTIQFTEIENGDLHVTGNITGLEPGLYGFHIHALGDITSCDTTGAHYDPDGNNHGGPEHEERHVGDLGNVRFVGTGAHDAVATVNFRDGVIALRGRKNILGRALVLHAQEDDLGLGDHETSLTTGNAGPRVACGVIGILSPSDPWNSAKSVTPSTILLVLVLSFMYFWRK